MKSEKILVAGGFALISLIWGSTWLAIKIGLESIPPLWGVAIRFTFAALLLGIISAIRRQHIPLNREALGVYLSMALLSFSLPFALVYWGEQTVASGLASILFCIYPFGVALLSHFMLPGEHLTLPKTAGTVIGFLGIVVVFWSDFSVNGGSIPGMIAMLVSALMQATVLVILKKKGTHIDPLSLNLGGITIGLVFMYGMALILEDASGIHWTTSGVLSILYLGSFGTVVTFTTYFWLLKRIEAAYLSLSSFITPVIAVILGAAWLGESLPSRVLAGAAVVLSGILIANSRDLVAALRRYH